MSSAYLNEGSDIIIPRGYISKGNPRNLVIHLVIDACILRTSEWHWHSDSWHSVGERVTLHHVFCDASRLPGST